MSFTESKRPDVCSLYTGSDNPSVTPTFGYKGDLYARKYAGTPELYQKQDDGLSTNWSNVFTASTSVAVTVGFFTTTAGRNKHTRVVTVSPDSPSLTTDHILLVDTGGASAINLPAGVDGAELEIKDLSGNAAADNITITPFGAETIDGAANLVINADFESFRLIFNSGNWNIMQ